MLHPPRDYKRDERPATRGWVPGNYFCLCADCGAQFIGHKRCHQCADCAYGPPKPEQYTSHVCAWLIDKFQKAWPTMGRK